MPTDKNPKILIRNDADLHTIDDVLNAVFSQQKDLLEQLEKVKKMELAPGYNRLKAEAAVKAIGDLRKTNEENARLVVEIASEYGVPQRVMAEHIGVAPATILRWIRNPLGYSEEEYANMMDALLAYDEWARDNPPEDPQTLN